MVHFKLFEFLWKEDLNYLFTEFMKYEPNEYEIRREIERLVKIESQILEIPDYLNIGPICLNTNSVRVSLKTFAYNWKCKYASVLHELARNKLQESIIYRENVQKRLSINVTTLEQLNDALRLLEELSDMENKIDKIYLPIENVYNDLIRYELILTRQELEQVTSLRENWSELMKSAEIVRSNLLQEKRNVLEQELDKQVKTFVVEVIRFRNSFDAVGPSVVGISPYEAIKRLFDFQKQYDVFDSRRKTLDSISILFGLQCKPFPELDKTGEELALLNQLYKVYQVFLNFDKSFRATLWSDVDLNKSHATMQSFWSDFQALPEKLKENWEAYFDLRKELIKYLDVLPMLLLLNEKEIRNRHWMQVMQVTHSAFRLEASVFRLNDLVDIGFDRHAAEIKDICYSAKKEQELESKMRAIEEEWNEQMLNFVNYKDYGEIIFDKVP
jgi:dynein heavy chain